MPSPSSWLSPIRLARLPSRSQDSDAIDSNAEDHNYDEIRYRLLNHRRSIEMVKLPRGSRNSAQKRLDRCRFGCYRPDPMHDISLKRKTMPAVGQRKEVNNETRHVR